MEFKLIIKKINNTLSEKENIIFEKWYNASTSHSAYFNSVKKNHQTEIGFIDAEKGWLRIQSNLKKRKQKTAFYKYAAVASILLLVSVGFVFSKSSSDNIIEIQAVDIEIGTNKATLTLEDGSIVALEKGNAFKTSDAVSNGEELVYESKKNQSKPITYNYLTIPRGGEFFLKLSDGTQVWLNSESKLKYPVNFKKGEPREVELLYGEAYFDVSPSTNHNGSKFRVLNKYQNIEVLGTEFNVKAYKDEANIYTTLVEGSVSINVENVNEILKPSQQANLNLNNNGIEVSKVNIFNEISWKDGVFSFRRMSLQEIMKVLSRWYDIDVEFANPELKKEGFNGVLGKDQKIEEILMAIKNFKIIKEYKIVGKTIILK